MADTNGDEVALSAAGLALRTCTRCGQTDDHPRHVIAAPDGQPKVNFHMDCHALMGCPICIEQRTGAEKAKGDALREHLVALEPLSEERVAELLSQPAAGKAG